MIKVVDVAGIRLDNYSVREEMTILARELSEQGFHTIEEVNTDTLMMAVSDDTVRSALTAMDHSVISEVAILEVVGAATYQRRREVEHHDFFYELMRLIERNRKKVCLIGGEETEVLAMEEKLRGLFPRCEMVSYAQEHFAGDMDSFVNEINAAAPNVILCTLPSPAQERFFMEGREKISANLWYGIGRMDLTVEKSGLMGPIHRRIRARKLAKQLGSLRQESVTDEQS